MKFEIDEVVELISSALTPEFIGEDVIVRSGLTYREERKRLPFCLNVYAHHVEFPDGRLWWCSPEALRKKKPPEEASWDQIQKDIGWNPTKEVAHN